MSPAGSTPYTSTRRGLQHLSLVDEHEAELTDTNLGTPGTVSCRLLGPLLLDVVEDMATEARMLHKQASLEDCMSCDSARGGWQA